MSVIHTIISTFIIQLFGAMLVFIRSGKRRKRFPLWAALAVGGFVGLYFFPNIPRVEWFNFEFLVFFIIATGLMWLCFDEKPIKIVFFGVAAYAMQNFASALFFMIRGFAELPRGYSLGSVFIILTIFPAVYTVAYFLFARKVKAGDILHGSRIPFLIMSIVIVLIVNVLGLFSISEGLGRHNVVLFFRMISCAMALFIQFGLIEKERVLRDKETIAHLFNEAEKHRVAAKDNIEFINIKCHDLKKQISALRQISNQKEREESIDEIEKAVMIFDAIAKTDNKTLDIVLTEKSIQCQKRKIDFSYIADGEALRFMNSVDVFLLLENAIENAIESVMHIVDNEKRIIALNISAKGKMLSIHLENYIEAVPVFDHGLPVTSKEDKQHHGYGLKSIRYIAEKYSGNMEVSVKDDRFILDVLIPIKDVK